MSSDFSLTSYLRRLPYFAAVDNHTLAEVTSAAYPRKAAAGETLFFEGEESAGLWLIETGRVKVYKLNPEGQEHILRIFGDNDTFNDISALDGGTNPANAAALSDSRLWIVPSPVFSRLILNDPSFALRVIHVLSGRVRALVNQIENLTLYSVTARVARLLLRQVEDPALSGSGVTRAALASHLATTPQTISTALRELETAGAIQFDRHQIQIVDEKLLRSIAML